MRAVSVWRCSCSTHLKVVSEIDGAGPSERQAVVCPGCSHATELDGRVIEVFYEERDGVWTSHRTNGTNR